MSGVPRNLHALYRSLSSPPTASNLASHRGSRCGAMRCYKLLDAMGCDAKTASPRCRWMAMLAALALSFVDHSRILFTCPCCSPYLNTIQLMSMTFNCQTNLCLSRQHAFIHCGLMLL